MIFIVDGTGPTDEREYAADMAKSFCKQLSESTKHRSIYERGPHGMLGLDTDEIAHRVAIMVSAMPKGEKIFLCGYSRGGAAVITAAWSVRPREIDAMFLFDAVDRAEGTMAKTIPANVRVAYHAMRNPEFSAKYDAAVSFAAKDTVVSGLKAAASLTPIGALFSSPFDSVGQFAGSASGLGTAIYRAETLKLESRNDFVPGTSLFGNCGTEPASRITTKRFMGTHGALGGVPWEEDEVPGDRLASSHVRDWMWRNFRHEKLFSHPHHG